MLKVQDSLAASKRLRNAGVPMEQADAIAGEVSAAVSGLVTREYLDERMELLEERMDSRFEKVYARFGIMDSRFDKMGAQFSDLNADVARQQNRWLFGVLAMNAGMYAIFMATLTFWLG